MTKAAATEEEEEEVQVVQEVTHIRVVRDTWLRALESRNHMPRHRKRGDNATYWTVEIINAGRDATALVSFRDKQAAHTLCEALRPLLSVVFPVK